MEHRWGRRIDVNVPVQLTVSGKVQTLRAQLTNLSVTGAMVRTDCLPRILSRVDILLEPSLSIAGYVARNCPDGIGIEWCDAGSAPLADWLRAVARRITPRTSSRWLPNCEQHKSE